jgi:hypothetical protein
MTVHKRSVWLGLLALGSLAAAGSAQARDVQWAVTIGGPVGVSVWGGAPRVHAPVVVAPPVVVPAPVVGVYPGHRHPGYGAHPGYGPPRHGHGRGHGWGRDRDRDGIPDRVDRRYTPPWDHDGDGIPNRYDRRDNRWHGAHHGGHGRWGDHRDDKRRGRD